VNVYDVLQVGHSHGQGHGICVFIGVYHGIYGCVDLLTHTNQFVIEIQIHYF
jgi:hypothetical protein